MADIVTGVTAACPDGVRKMSNKDCAFAYRESTFLVECGVSAELMDTLHTPHCIITSVTIKLKTGDRTEIRARMNEYARIRRERQPMGLSAGSVFKSAGGVPAGLLIDRAGLKGSRVGGAYISDKHANFIINDGTARFSDIIDLMEYAAAVVWLRDGVLLEREIKIVI